MITFPKVTPASKPKTREAQQVIYLYAFILIVFALAQLFTFADFLRLLESFNLPGGVPVAHLLGSVIVAGEVFALPFLLRMSVSRLMRFVSLGLGLLVPIAWLKLSFWVILTTNTVTNIGFLGTVVKLIPGWWAVSFSFALLILAIWAVWGLWPGKRK